MRERKTSKRAAPGIIGPDSRGFLRTDSRSVALDKRTGCLFAGGEAVPAMRTTKAGFVLLTVLFTLAGFLELVSVGLIRSTQELRSTNTFMGRTQAFTLAEAGVDQAIWELRRSGGDFLANEGWGALSAENAAFCPGGQTCYQKALGLPGATGTVLAINTTGAATTIRASDIASGVTQTVEAVFARSGHNNAPPLFGGNSIRLESQAYVDAYDSRNGAYTAAPRTGNRTPIHALTTNSANVGAVALGSNSTVDGDVKVGPTGVPSVVISAAAGAKVTGTREPAAAAYTPPPITAPADTSCGTNTLDVTGTLSMTVSAFLAGCYNRLVLESHATLTLTGDGTIALKSSSPTDVLLNSQSNLILNGQITLVTNNLSAGSKATVEVPAGGQPVKFYVHQSASFGSQSGVNNRTQLPKNFAFYYLASNTVSIGSQGAFYGFIYAPDATVNFNSQAEYFGSVVARTVRMGSQAKFHYDNALADEYSLDPQGTPPGLRMWRQL